MATKVETALFCLLTFAVSHVVFGEVSVVETQNQQFCSFFNNRAPKAQPGLKNCTWFKGNSCCQQQEIKATFERMKPLKGASVECQKYINYLMCYICAPNQNLFYRQERLTVCVEFCDKLYDACRSAILKGSIIGNLYSDGRGFCLSRRFQVDATRCFSFDERLDISGGSQFHINFTLLSLFGVLTVFVCQAQPAILEAAAAAGEGLPGKHRKPQKTKPKTTCQKKQTCSSFETGVESCGTRTKDSPAGESGQLQDEASKLRCTGLHRPVARATSPGNIIMSFQTRILLEKNLLALIVFLLHINSGHTEFTKGNIKMWAELISADLTDVARKGLRYEEIQRLYDKAQYATEYTNGTAKVLEVRSKLGTWFSCLSAFCVWIDWISFDACKVTGDRVLHMCKIQISLQVWVTVVIVKFPQDLMTPAGVASQLLCMVFLVNELS